VVAPEHQLHLDVHHRVAGEYPGLERLSDTGLDGFDEFPGDDTANDLVFEEEASAWRGGFEIDYHVPVLTLAAGLADKFGLHLFDALGDRLPIGHLRPAHVRLDLELPTHPIDDNLEMQLTHPSDDRLP